MSLITACPACQTEFEVTPQQLEVYDGKVRCGTCQYVFNAKAHLIEDGSDDNTALNTSLSDFNLSLSESSQSVATPDNALSLEVEQAAADNNNTLIQSLQIVDEVQSQNNKPAIEVNDGFIIPPKLSLDADSISTSNTPSVPSFLQDIEVDKQHLPVVKQPSHPWAYGILIFVLLLILGLQSTYALRTDLAAQYPLVKPWLVKGCQWIGCQVELPKNIALLTIDDADMQEHLEREGVLEFSSTLINHGNTAQAFPMIELTLTNIDDEPVIRRSFSPQEYLRQDSQNQSQKEIQTGLPAQEEVRIKMTLSANGANVAGFRVGLNYPS